MKYNKPAINYIGSLAGNTLESSVATVCTQFVKDLPMNTDGAFQVVLPGFPSGNNPRQEPCD